MLRKELKFFGNLPIRHMLIVGDFLGITEGMCMSEVIDLTQFVENKAREAVNLGLTDDRKFSDIIESLNPGLSDLTRVQIIKRCEEIWIEVYKRRLYEL